MEEESLAVNLAHRRPNLSVYARDGAVVFGVSGQWRPGPSPTQEWENIRKTFWSTDPVKNGGGFILGDFNKLARFFSLSQSMSLRFSEPQEMDTKEEETRTDSGPDQPNTLAENA